MIAEFMTVSGKHFDLADLRPEHVEIEDIAHHLSWTCRFNGAIKDWYNNGQHSYLVGEIVEALPMFPAAVRPFATLAGHVHDANETYSGDITSPMKNLLRYAAGMYGLRSPIDIVEGRMHLIVEQAFDLPAGCLGASAEKPGPYASMIYRFVKRADVLALQIEDHYLRPWVNRPLPDADIEIEKLVAHPGRNVWDREEAKARFLARFEVLDLARKGVTA